MTLRYEWYYGTTEPPGLDMVPGVGFAIYDGKEIICAGVARDKDVIRTMGTRRLLSGSTRVFLEELRRGFSRIGEACTAHEYEIEIAMSQADEKEGKT